MTVTVHREISHASIEQSGCAERDDDDDNCAAELDEDHNDVGEMAGRNARDAIQVQMESESHAARTHSARLCAHLTPS